MWFGSIFAGGLSLLPAQTTSIVYGSILDPRGLYVEGAEISLSGPALAGTTTVTSAAAGFYRAAGLPAGTYDVRVAKTGFATVVHQGLIVTVNRQLAFDVALELANATVTIS